MRTVIMLAFLALATALPAAAAPIAGLHGLVGTWKCTYRTGAAHLAYDAVYAYDLPDQVLRQTDTWAGGGAEESVAYDAQRHGWTAIVFDGQGSATVMHAPGSDPNHIVYRSVYPDAGIAVTFDRLSATTYVLHGTVHAGGKTITSLDTCLRAAG